MCAARADAKAAELRALVSTLHVCVPSGPHGYVTLLVSASRRYTQTVALMAAKMRYELMKNPGPVWYLCTEHRCHHCTS